jgi:hypothetical protein
MWSLDENGEFLCSHFAQTGQYCVLSDVVVLFHRYLI